jgi:UDP-glucose 4-epimerase
MKFAVTGGAGFVGNNIVRLLVSKGHDVVVIDNLHTGKKENLKEILEKIEFHEIDIRNYNEMEKILKDVDGIFHEAALTIVQESFQKEEEYFDVNVKGTENIFKIAEKFKKKVVYASSSSIYGDTKEIPIKENFERKPINPYGKTKVEKEKLAEEFWDKGVNIIGLRYFNVYGKGQTGTYAGVITQFMKRLRDNLPPIIHGEGNQVRDFISVEDIAKANLLAMESNTSQDFLNIGTGKSISILDLAKMMIKISSKKISPILDDKLPGDVEKSQADVIRCKEKIGFYYNMNIYDGLKKLMNE